MLGLRKRLPEGAGLSSPGKRLIIIVIELNTAPVPQRPPGPWGNVLNLPPCSCLDITPLALTVTNTK